MCKLSCKRQNSTWEEMCTGSGKLQLLFFQLIGYFTDIKTQTDLTSQPAIVLTIKILLSICKYQACFWSWESCGFKTGQEKTLWYNDNKSFLLTPVTNPAPLRGTESLWVAGGRGKGKRERESKRKLRRKSIKSPTSNLFFFPVCFSNDEPQLKRVV